MDHDSNEHSQQLNIWNSVVHKKRPPVTISNYRDSLQIVDVFVAYGMDVDKGQPLFVVKRGENLKAEDGTIIEHWHPYFIPDEHRLEAGRELAAEAAASKSKADGPDDAATLKEKVVSNESQDAVNIKKAEYHSHPTRTIIAPKAFRLTKVLIKAGMEVLKGGPLFAFEFPKKEGDIMPLQVSETP